MTTYKLTNNNATNYDGYFKIGSLNILRPEEIFFLKYIKKFIIDYYEKLGMNFDNEKRYILKSDSTSPLFCPKSLNPCIENELILLTTKDYSFWAQVIYQLSHEITHCFIYCNNKAEELKAKWIEETICEAMSLYFLKLFSESWEKFGLSKLNKSYNQSIENYLNDILNIEGTNKLYTCLNITELQIINENSEQKRENRLNEMKDLYLKIKEEDIIGLIKYKDYIKKIQFY